MADAGLCVLRCRSTRARCVAETRRRWPEGTHSEGEGKQRPEGLLAASLALSYTRLRLRHIRQLVYRSRRRSGAEYVCMIVSVPIQTEKTDIRSPGRDRTRRR